MTCETDPHTVIDDPYDNPLIITIKVTNSTVFRVLVDTGSSTNVMTLTYLKELGYKEVDLTPYDYPLVDFGGQRISSVGVIQLPVRYGAKEKGLGRRLSIKFTIVDINIPYNIVMGQPMINRTKSIICTYQLKVQLETDEGTVGAIYGNQKTARECYVKSLRAKEAEPKGKKRALEADEFVRELHEEQNEPQPSGKYKEVSLGTSEKKVRVGTEIDPHLLIKIIDTLVEYIDVFASTAEEMPGIHPSIMTHELNIKEGSQPAK